ncbi:cortex morphogenetic protein CmpA [Alicyclobacillus mali]|uniref:Cortex morphogenetic protein CmpA n=1 Tax=Alicyclobacillus mali (ex Roth et al. 2021) TaxID=1123961 RepID=A0ABS0EZY0_9BACL|nr:cortex morphogenetic protein CmpA [Alicyclobacillus mali (ex Roth et al. 2021)]MBF8376608.1 cortex morphogenetic protein CmpA [Alicyclobacillus mali (ex Roth et al. 2021)]
MPEWLRSQLRRAFLNRDRKAIVMLNEAYYRYRRSDVKAEP